MLPFISKFHSAVLVVSPVSLMVEQVGIQVGTIPPALSASLLEAAHVECRETIFHWNLLKLSLAVHGCAASSLWIQLSLGNSNERQQTAASGEWHQQKLTKTSRKVSLQPHRAEQDSGVLWGALRQANMTRTKPRRHCSVYRTEA